MSKLHNFFQVWGYFICIFLLGLFLFFFQIEDRGLWSSHEGRAGQIAQNMQEDGNYVLQRLHCGEISYQKPPLFYWLICLVSKVTGKVDSFSIRFPSAISAFLLSLLVFLVGWSSFSPQVGAISSLVLMTSIRFWWQARVGRIDMLLSFFIIGAGFSFYYGYNSKSLKRWIFYLCGYLGLAGGMLAKGPIAIVLTACGIGTYILWKRDWKEVVIVCATWFFIPIVFFLSWQIYQLNWIAMMILGFIALACISLWKKGSKEWICSPHFAGLLLFFLLVSPWFILIHQATAGEFTWRFFVRHHLIRFLGKGLSSQLFGTTMVALSDFKRRPFLFYIPHIIIGMLPWILILPVALRKLWLLKLYKKNIGFFLSMWIVLSFLFLSIARFKRPDYILPLIPLLSIFIGWVIYEFYEDLEHKITVKRAFWGTWGIIAIAMLGVWLIYLFTLLGFPPSLMVKKAVSSNWFRAKFNHRDATSFLASIHFFEDPKRLVFLGVAFFLLTLEIIAIFVKRNYVMYVVGLMGALMITLYLSYLLYIAPSQEAIRSPAAFAKQVEKNLGKKGKLILFYEGHSIVFYLNRKNVQKFSQAMPLDYLFPLDKSFAKALNHHQMEEKLISTFTKHGHKLSKEIGIEIDKSRNTWRLTDGKNNFIYRIKVGKDKLSVYRWKKWPFSLFGLIKKCRGKNTYFLMRKKTYRYIKSQLPLYVKLKAESIKGHSNPLLLLHVE